MNSENNSNEVKTSETNVAPAEEQTTTPVASTDEKSEVVEKTEVAEIPESEEKSSVRPRLNPKGAEVMQAVGSEVTAAAPEPVAGSQVVAEETSTPAATSEEPADNIQTSEGAESSHTEVATSEAIEKAMSAPLKKIEPVEIPKAEELDDDIEAQLAAAMVGETTAAPTVSEESTTSDSTPAPVSDSVTVEISEDDRLKGKVQSVHGDDVFIDVGSRLSAVVSSRQFPKGPPEIGQEVTVKVSKVDEAEGLIYANLAGGRQKVAGNWDAIDVGQIVDCIVTKTVKGGLEVTVSNLRGFMPAGQVDIGFISDLEPYVEQKMTVQVIEVNPKKRNLVVSRRACLQAEREEAQKDIWETLSLGQQHTGTVKTLKNYGAFIDLGMIDGFLHVGEISWMRVHHPSDILSEGQQVEVQIISLDPEKKRIGLGMRQLITNPWTEAENKYEKGNTVSGKVTRTTDFGAFVELEQGVEGLIHISELDHKRVHKVTDVLKEGQQVDAQILEVDQKKHRISLSLKSLIEKPKSAKKDEPEEPFEPHVRKRKGPLKGGTGSSEGSGLFGNSGDFK